MIGSEEATAKKPARGKFSNCRNLAVAVYSSKDEDT